MQAAEVLDQIAVMSRSVVWWCDVALRGVVVWCRAASCGGVGERPSRRTAGCDARRVTRRACGERRRMANGPAAERAGAGARVAGELAPTPVLLASRRGRRAGGWFLRDLRTNNHNARTPARAAAGRCMAVYVTLLGRERGLLSGFVVVWSPLWHQKRTPQGKGGGRTPP